ncbi:precorrin-3B C(17)-methyltransferase [Caldalkalibacillus salinus]|uniref:precorrin-3B C(17)-methyltransferase n=1 Tax=Caldalkalibacillus salinus TaxID=2803787 RepID=UPI001924BC11|nr:precorrin-3B C(17)-methyltransferase [Caldalkalibacillus salinus]
MKGKLWVIGFGPGSFDHITKRAQEAIEDSDCVIGYKTYIQLIEGLLSGQEIISTGMSEEVSRAQAAVKLAEQGRKVAVISSGDAGVYGMAGLVYEVLVEKGWKEDTGVAVEVVPGISAINSCASRLGAPVMHDACTISLSDHLTPWELIAKRIEAAAAADFVVSLYNPKSGRRTKQIVEAQKILLRYRSPETPVGLVKSAYRDREHVVITTLKDMLEHEIGMLTTVIIGNASTFLYDNKMITPRGYQRKYTLDKEEQRLKPAERLKPENEPWALHAGDHHETSSSSATPASRPLDWASQALQAVTQDGYESQSHVAYAQSQGQEQAPIFELAVSPGVANKNLTSQQLLTIAQVVGEQGQMSYTPDHHLLLQIPTHNPDDITEALEREGLILTPVGDVFQLKACDFCEGEKKDAIPYAEEIQEKLGGIDLPKELKLGFNGCGMACYGAVNDDIGIVYRKGAFDLFLGGKTVGRTAHPGQIVAEGVSPEDIVNIVEQIILEYKERGHPNERFHKFFKRVQSIQGFPYRDVTPKLDIEPAACGED